MNRSHEMLPTNMKNNSKSVGDKEYVNVIGLRSRNGLD